MIDSALRTLAMYAFMLVTVRVMGKRQLGELEVSELITTLMVSELAVTPVTNRGVSLLAGIVPIAVLIAAETVVSRIMLRSVRLKRFFGGTPSILVRGGRLDYASLKDAHVGVDELLSMLRQNGVSNVEDVEYAILEANGRLSVIPTVSSSPPCADDMGVKKAERGIAHGVIIDGYVNERSLDQAKRSRKWLDGVLEREGIDVKDVALLTVDDGGKVWYQLRPQSSKPCTQSDLRK